MPLLQLVAYKFDNFILIMCLIIDNVLITDYDLLFILIGFVYTYEILRIIYLVLLFICIICYSISTV